MAKTLQQLAAERLETQPGTDNATRVYNAGWHNGEWTCCKCGAGIGKNLNGESPFLLARRHAVRCVNPQYDYVSFIADDALSFRESSPELIRQCGRGPHILVGWQCGFEPLFVLCHSYLPNTELAIDEAIELATDGLAERGWFSDAPTEPDHIVIVD